MSGAPGADLAGDLRRADPALVGVTSLAGVVGWLRSRGGAARDLDVVAMDEFSHDAVAPLGDGRWAVFGAT